jgi:hypothetical protein
LSSSPYGSNPINAAIMNVQNLIPTFPYRLRIDILLQLQTESWNKTHRWAVGESIISMEF